MVRDEQVLVDRISTGDNTAFQEFVERYKKKIYYIAYDITGDHEMQKISPKRCLLKCSVPSRLSAETRK